MLELKIGDKAVYPAQGVAEVVGIDNKEINGSVTSFYVLKVLDSEMQILVPKNKADQVGLRAVATNREVDEVFDILREQDVHIDKQTWNRRYREYVNKLHSGDPLEVAAVFRDLSLLKKEKSLSFGERKTYDQAMSLLVQELAAAKDVDEEKIRKELDKIFTKV